MSRRSKRLFIDATPLIGNNPSGIGKLLLSHIAALAKDDKFMESYDVVLFVTLGKVSRLQRYDFDKRMVIRELPLPLKIINLLMRLRLMPPIDLYLGTGTYLFGNYRRLPLMKSTSLTFVHDAVYAIFPETVEPKNLAHLKQIVPDAFRKSDTVLTLTAESKRELAALYPEYASKLRVVPCGIDRGEYRRRKNTEIDSTLQEVGVKAGAFLLFVGNIEPRKNIHYLLDVYVEMIKNGSVAPAMSLVLVGGDGWNNQPLVDRIRELSAEGYDIIRPPTRLSDDAISDLYAASAMTCLFSIHEGFGMTPIEAMSVGGKATVSDIEVLREVNGGAVSYVPLDNQVSAAKITAAAIKSPRNEQAVNDVLATYTWERASTLLTKYISEV